MRLFIVISISILGVVLSIILSWVYFHFSYFEPDTVSYLFQAKLFERGKLCLDAPPEMGFSSSPHINVLNGKWYSKYPFGNALMLMFGELFNAPWIVPAINTGLTLLLLYVIVAETFGEGSALVAIIIGLISPATLGMGCNWFSESVSRFFLAIYMLGLITALKNGAKRLPMIGHRTWLPPLLSGFALGYAFNTRPIPAVAFGISGAGLALSHLISIRNVREGKKAFLKNITLFFIPFAFMMILCLLWNFYLTGDPLKFTHNAAQPYDKMGFGKRAEGYEPDLENAFNFTPQWAFQRLWKHIIPCVSFNTLGWGYYRPDIFTFWNNYEPLLLVRIIPLAFPMILMIIPLFHSQRKGYNIFFLLVFILNLSIYFFFYFEGSTWGVTPVNARYYNECTLLGIIPLIARGITIIHGWIKRIPSKIPIVISCILLLALTVNTVYTYVYIADPYRNWSDVYQKLPRLVKKEGLHNAVIFIPYSRDAPMGDYPFKSIDEADVVYFKLGPNKVWGLNNSDWKKVYSQYFVGKKPYIYDGGKLINLIK